MSKILVVDDEKDNLTILDFYLKQRGFETILTTNGNEAISVAQKESVDLIILDIMMPEMDGFEVCKRLKENPLTQDIPIIFLTARYLDKKDLIYGLSLGAIDYITKPFDEGELFARINVAIKVRQIEKSLKNQRDYLNTIINSVGNDLLIINPDFTVDMVNNAFLKRRNLTLKEVSGKHCHEVSFFKKERCFNANTPCPTMLALSGTSAKNIYEFKDQNTGKQRYINISAFPIFDEKNQVTKIIEIQEDITEIVAREREIGKINTLLENILLNMGDALIYIDPEGKIIKQNPAGKEILNKIGKIQEGFLLQLGSLSLDDLYLLSESSERETSNILQIEDRYFKITSRKINIENSSGLILTISDITKELKTQEELIQSAKLVSIGELAASIAHEVNNPITGIIGYSELLSLHKAMLPEKVNDILDKILKESYRVKNIVENLLKFSRRQQITDMAYVDLGASLREIIPLMEASFHENNINLTYQIPTELPLVFCNSGLIQQAVLNLLQNAFDAITSKNKGDHVELKVQIDEKNLYLTVEDNGPGIPPELTDKIFEPFFTTKSKGKGTGLGLSLIHRIVQIHKGEIKLETSPEGTKFIIILPINEPKVSMNIIKDETLEKIQNKRAIIIDDDPTIVDYLSDILMTFKFIVDEVRDKSESLQLLKSNNYDLTIIDIKLPDGDGFEIYKYLLDNYPEKAENVVFITADVSLDTREKLRKTGKPFLIKPFSFNELINTLRLA
ncbi:MAG: response regulator [Proteobacteria bacterium]|nr:response regulator [Pseudomonadota bacterium]